LLYTSYDITMLMPDPSKPVTHMSRIILSERSKLDVSKEESPSGGVMIQGRAVPFGKYSRNGVLYRDESIRKTHENLKGRTVLFNHNMDWPVGFVTKTWVEEDDGLYYSADINPEVRMPSGVALVDALKRGDVRNVSISVIPNRETVTETSDSDNIEVDVEDWIELSIVTTPGFPDASLSVKELLEIVRKEKGETAEKGVAENNPERTNEKITNSGKTGGKTMKRRNEQEDPLPPEEDEEEDEEEESDEAPDEDEFEDEPEEESDEVPEEDEDEEEDELPPEAYASLERRLRAVEEILIEHFDGALKRIETIEEILIEAAPILEEKCGTKRRVPKKMITGEKFQSVRNPGRNKENAPPKDEELLRYLTRRLTGEE
jgi:HK97 family phage prohead protease